MKRNRLTLLAVVLAAVAAFAVSHPFSGTINTPAVATWVDGSGNSIAPYVVIGPAPQYVDSSGYMWYIVNILSAPTAGDSASLQPLYYTTVNCTGTAYVIEPPYDLPSVVHTAGSAGSYYVAGAAAAVTIQSQLLSASCTSDVETSNIYVAIGPLTQPTLPAVPWHLEAR